MKNLIKEFKKMDWLFLGAIFTISLIGLLSIYSSSFRDGKFLNFKKQLFFFFLGTILMFSFSFFKWQIFKENPYLVLILYFFALFLLFLSLFFPPIRGARAWIKIGKFTFEPIALMKFALLILLAKFFSQRHSEMYKISHLFLSFFYLFLPLILLIFQPDLGSALVIFSLWLGILLVSGVRTRQFFAILLILILISALGWQKILKDYQKERISSFLFKKDPLGTSWSLNQAKIAIGSGGILGKGFKKGSQTQLFFLPEPQTDFIFSAIGEEFGFFTLFFIIFLFFLILWQISNLFQICGNNFARLFLSGVLILWFSQLFLSAGVNLALLPTIGLSIPFLSYGGSETLINFILAGIVQAIKRELT